MNTLPLDVQELIEKFQARGFEAYAVGGAVRDMIMNRQTKDWDLTTNAKPEEILALFPDSFYDNQFGTVGVKVRNTPDGDVTQVIEVTTYRSEIGYSDSRHPDTVVWGKTLQEDLSRRDLTINAIAFDGKNFIDPYNGREDITNKKISTVGNPIERFGEDALRIMRAIRIATELAFMIDPVVIDAICKLVPKLQQISMERIRDELFKILSSNNAADGILLLKNTGILAMILPEVVDSFGVDQKSPGRHHIYDVGTHLVESLRHCTSGDPTVRLATLLHDIGKPKTVRHYDNGLITFFNHEVVGARMAKDIGYRLKLSKKQIDLLFTLVRWHQFTVDERQTDSAIRRFIRHTGIENLDAMLALRIGDRLGGGARETSWRLELFKKRLEEVQQQPFTPADLLISGFDIMAECEVKPGPIVGIALNALFSEVEQGLLENDHEKLMIRLRELKSTLLK